MMVSTKFETIFNNKLFTKRADIKTHIERILFTFKYITEGLASATSFLALPVF